MGFLEENAGLLGSILGGAAGFVAGGPAGMGIGVGLGGGMLDYIMPGQQTPNNFVMQNSQTPMWNTEDYLSGLYNSSLGRSY